MPSPSNPVSILLIDDDAMSRELLTMLLQSEGYAVESSDSGDSALAYLRSAAIDPTLILSDMQMPGLCGPALAAELRRAAPAALLLAISGTQPSAQAIAPFHGFLLKPFSMEQLADAISATQTLQAGIYTSPSQPASKPLMEIQTLLDPHPQTTDAVDTTAAKTPALNETIYQQLATSMTPPQLREIYTMCLSDTRQRIALMRNLTVNHDDARFIREAHAIKGSCGMLGATQLHGMASELERLGPEAAPQGAAEVNSLDELSTACDRLERILGSRV